MMVKTRRFLSFVLCSVPAVGVLAVAILVASPFFAQRAGALPLCPEASGKPCRFEVQTGIVNVIDSIHAGAPNVDDQISGVSDFNTALLDFEAAINAIGDTHRNPKDRCINASNNDRRALNRTSGGVTDAFSLPADQFSSSNAFNATHTALTALVRSMIDTVDNNLDEIEFIGKGFNPKHVAGARERLDRARDAVAQGDLAAAAGHVRGAYDVVDGDGNVAPDCLWIVPEHCPKLPFPTFFKGTTEFNNTIRSQMWIIDGMWWGAFSNATSGIHFYQRVGNNFVRRARIDKAFAGKPDTVWNGSDLFILIHIPSTTGSPLARLYKYSYAPATQTYALFNGFPIDLPLPSLVTDIAFDQDSTGKLWATYTDPSDGTVHVIWSTSKDHTSWDTTGTILASNLATDTEEAATIVPFGKGKIGVVWDNQAAGEIGFRFHRDGDAEDDWSPQETVDCCEGIPGVADNHLSLRAVPDGRLFLIAKDGIENGRLHLYIRSVDGVWGPKTILDPDPNAAPTRPAVVLDLENDDAHVIYRDSNKNGFVFFVKTPLDRPNFTPLCVFINATVNSATSTKQALDETTTELIAAASGGDRIFSNVIDLAPSPAQIAESTPQPAVETLQASSDPLTARSESVAGSPAPNYGLIQGGRLSRSETPTDEDQYRWLRAQGVNTIVTCAPQRMNFRGLGFEKSLWIPLDNGVPPSETQAVRFLRFVQDPDNKRVHLQSAKESDCVAMLRALVSYAIEGQTLEAAVAEARLDNEGKELSSAQLKWLEDWAAIHKRGSHRRR
jgi:hypothetical protein